MVVLFALLLPLILIVAAIVLDVGNWFVHQKHLQTKVDAAAFAGGAVWGFPCGTDVDADIEIEARKYFGEHVQADGAHFTSTLNPQVGLTPGSRLHVVLNGSTWWDDDQGWAPADTTSPVNPSICDSKTLDVKATEENITPLFGLLPLFPDIKRKARVEVQEVEGLTGLLPIAVRLPQPLSAAAVFYDEDTREILDVKYFREICTPSTPGCILDIPTGLGQWTTEPSATDPSPAWASFNVAGATGVVVALSFRPRCGAGTPPAGPPCLEDSGWIDQPVDDFCRQASGTVQCYDVNGAGVTQEVQAGVHFIYGHLTGSVPAGPSLPDLRSAWLESASCPSTGYFTSSSSACLVELNVRIDAGSCLRGPDECFDDPAVTPAEETRTAGAPNNNVQVRYCLVRHGETGNVCEPQFGIGQDLSCSGESNVLCTSGTATHPQINAQSRGNAFAIEVKLRNTVVNDFPTCQDTGFNDNCRFFFIGSGYFGDSVPPTAEDVLAAPIQRSFMGDIDRTGALRWLRLTVDRDCNLNTLTDRIMGTNPITGDDAASQPSGEQRCYVVEMGIAGGLARDQDEPPIALNLGGVVEGSSQRALINCDDDLANLKSEIETGCQKPPYAANKFDTTPLCASQSGFFETPKPAPFHKWPPFRCVKTQPTAAGNQIVQGFNQRLFGKSNNPKCPDDDATQRVKGRNYWHRENNDFDDPTFAWDGDTPYDESDDWGNQLSDGDPRLVTLFFTTYDSFTDNGNEVYPIVGFGNFYITGYGRTGPGGWQGGGPDDPCDDGNGSSEYEYTGNEPPPDLDYAKNTTWAWGHFVKDVQPNPFTTGGSGVLCNPEASFMPCVAVLVE